MLSVSSFLQRVPRSLAISSLACLFVSVSRDRLIRSLIDLIAYQTEVGRALLQATVVPWGAGWHCLCLHVLNSDGRPRVWLSSWIYPSTTASSGCQPCTSSSMKYDPVPKPPCI